MDHPITPPRAIDLHMHTFFSDGKYSPEDMLCRAAERGITTLAITDHDNTRGSRQGMSMAAELGIELIPAIELTCSWPGCSVPFETPDVDLLGYFVDLDDPGFQAFEKASLEDACARVAGCCAALTAVGFPVSMEDLFAVNPNYAGLVQLVQALQRKGHAASWDDAAEMVAGAWDQERPAALTVERAIEQIHAAGGVAVLAHPAALTGHGAPLQPADIAALVQAGLDGIEVHHRSAKGKALDHVRELAQRFNLLSTGGSDEHGWFTDLAGLGSQPVSPEMVEALRARSVEVRGRGRD